MKRLSKKVYLWPIIAGVVGYGTLIILGITSALYILSGGDLPEHFQMRRGFTPELAVIGSLYLLCYAAYILGTVMYFILLYKSWKAIQDGKARTTPGQAVGFLFIPLFNFYWVFRAWYGFAQDYNGYTERHGVTTTKLNTTLFLTYCILIACGVIPFAGFLTLIAAIVLSIIVANKTIDAVNVLPESP